ncbi:MAG: esterase-like activity of phytase family protein, partial [Alphaproteobacteria bacterium]|nr:esterase-like activity of phytase family protein [Alphaproteobacteria bacterium]
TGSSEAVGPAALRRLLHHDGRPLEGRRWTDAEGLAPAPDGGFFVSFEQAHRIVHYPAAVPDLSRASQAIASPPGIERAPANAGLEAIAAWSDGTLVAFAEDLRDEAGDTRGWIGIPPAWREFSWAYDGFKPTGAVVAHDGALLVLERRFSFFSLAARILRVRRQDLQPGSRVAGEVLGEWSAPDTIDNFEGIAARRGPDGEQLVYVVSDDNFRPMLQRTLLLCFAVT